MKPFLYIKGRSDLQGITDANAIFPRDKLIQEMYTKLMEDSWIILSSPAGSGKTSLIQLFYEKYSKEYPIIYISCIGRTPYLSDFANGIITDDSGAKWELRKDGKYIICFDDAQEWYHKDDFWNGLSKNVLLHRNIKLIVSAVHTIKARRSSPVSFSLFPHLYMNDFLLNEAESKEFLTSKYGFPERFNFPKLKKLIITQCNGLIAALRISVNQIVYKFGKETSSLESLEKEIINYYLSNQFISHLLRCFGEVHESKDYQVLRDLLLKCYFNEEVLDFHTNKLDSNVQEIYLQLLKSGILKVENNLIKFSSPLAQRYFSRNIFYNRSEKNPSSLFELIKESIENLSMTSLSQSVSKIGDFPKEKTFQIFFTTAITELTNPLVSIIPELSKNIDTYEKIPGSIDLFLNGNLLWGIELLINGDRLNEHISRFDIDGKYSGLKMNDYVLIDLRGNLNGEIPPKILLHPKRITVVFKIGDFSQCTCLFGNNPDPIILKLKN